MKICDAVGWGLILLAAAPLWPQEQATAPAPAVSNPPLTVSPVTNGNPNGDNGDNMTAGDDSASRMLTPPPVGGGSYPISFTSEERSNYLRGGVTFNSAYSDNVLAGIGAGRVGSESYSIWPTIALDLSRPRLHWVLTYAPGFTFYQHISAYNESDEDLAVEFRYRVSPHVTFSVRDGLQKSSNVFNQPDAAAGVVSGGTAGANLSVIAPVADRLSNTGNVGMAYQFAANSMVGASGTFSNLHYPDPAEVPGLYDSASEGGSAFYALRLSKQHYFGVTYQYQRLLSYPAAGTNLTQTHAALAFYTLYLNSRFSISAFGGPEYAELGPQLSTTGSTPQPGTNRWDPEAGASLSWQGPRSSVAIAYAHTISGGGGLAGAVRLDNASASLRQQLTRTLSVSASGGYAQNDLLGTTTLASGNGHTFTETASLQQIWGQHVNLQLGYTRLHQDYSTVAVLAANPTTNREFVSLSYQFSRPLGR
jgi:hypothetical protein